MYGRLLCLLYFSYTLWQANTAISGSAEMTANLIIIFFSWLSMLFAAGMGIGLMYFSVAEPMQHYSNEVFAYKTPVQRAQNGLRLI
jgi:choline-glycine betaine transporter